ncbi:ABC transporter permease [Neptunicella marina]|uniref:ABC transporter permease n=1 Tax=Neptunicella marina TaxID=2125989 RepID=A0A8J6IWQ6_9ALTE|nr:ABC transporter permease [Neptunicella marina]MBC3766995.1 ABC transporter permease [Neptunicella marina]
MFQYYLKLALLSIKRNPILSGLMVTAIALGIGACMTTITVNYLMSADPIPQKSDKLFYVQLDSWDPNDPFDEPNEPPDQLTWTDATNLLKAKKATRQVMMAQSVGAVEPEQQDAKPYMASIRLTSKDFFGAFDTPFLYGGGWSDEADVNREFVTVISRETNDKLFGGQNSVGKTIRVLGNNFKVVGVLDNWVPVPRFYDLTTDQFAEPEEMFMPIMLKEELELPSSGNTNCWKRPDDGFKGFLNSECVNFQMWVELESEQQKQAYKDYIDNYVKEQKTLGRFARPLNNRLSDVNEWMENQEVVADDAQIMLWLSFMFLLVCLLNTIGLLLAKFTGKTGEISLRRAVGASRKDIFVQHLIETACIGLAGGIAGLGLAMLGLQGIKVLYGSFADRVSSLDFNLVIIALILALLSSIAAGLYPTWRACAIAPARALKDQ